MADNNVPQGLKQELNFKAQLHSGYKGILGLLKQKEQKKGENEAGPFSPRHEKEESSDDELAGRSVCQEIDYQDKKLA